MFTLLIGISLAEINLDQYFEIMREMVFLDKWSLDALVFML